ncbi:MAG: Asp-tRNA(Asn)/Glu-tRNA(Gln) amidotransferase subunit GatC [Ignavibacteria bacterium]|nr:Asp-tRNA(Asn)/Glu-tRNA(Gln) amidotransferase subunit GatC [Ignavibacteria bacterium]
MSVTIKDVEHIAKLAKLHFNEDEMKLFTHQLNEILTYIEKLNKLDTTGVEPLSQVIELANVFRSDNVGETISTKEALSNSPAKMDPYFKVPKVIG